MKLFSPKMFTFEDYMHPTFSHSQSTGYAQDPKTQTLNPAVTGASVIGIKYDSGVLIAADTLGSYGSMAKIRHVSRLHTINEQV